MKSSGITCERTYKIIALLAALAFGRAVLAQPAPQATTQPVQGHSVEADRFLRVVEEKGKSVALQIACRDYMRTDGQGPRVGLIAVAHIADGSFFKEVEKALESYEVVLFESVKPPGAGGAHGETDQEKIESTKAAIRFIGGFIETHKAEKDAYPRSLDALLAFTAEHDPRLRKFIELSLTDAWGHALKYELRDPEPAAANQPEEVKQGGQYSLMSLGGDGIAGGEGANADIALSDLAPPKPLTSQSDDGLQSQLASALGLEFQLDALPYEKDNWRCSDMAMDEVSRRLKRHGIDFEEFGGTLAGTSLSATLVKGMLSIMRVLDSMLEGALADTFKVVLIEMLGDEKILDVSLEQLGEGFAEVIVADRNQVAINDLKRIIDEEPDVKSVAILYGAAHMPDMIARLGSQLNYAVAADADAKWMTALTVDFTKSAVSQAQVRQIRMMIKQMIRQQLRAK